MAIQFDNTNTGTVTLKPPASGSVALVLPSADGTSGQVISTDGSGNLSFTTAGGALNDLTDVSLTSVADGDLLRYNGTASEWQNTNLGISIAPTISLSAGTIYTNIPTSFTITNHASYDDPAYFFQLKSGSTVVVDNDSFTRDLYGDTITFTPPATSGTYTLEARTQDFGDIASEITTTSVTVTPTPALRYYRLTFVGATGSNYLRDFRVYTGAGQTGTVYPSNMTSDTTPSPYVASSSGPYSSTYAAWKAFDSSVTNTGWWNLSQSPYSTAWVQIDLGSDIIITSAYVRMNITYTDYTLLKIEGSTTGSFSGEQIELFSTTSKSEITNFG